ncbi:hypothetical protein [Anaeromicropila populeti]|uniref:Lipoprotein n=1 Tax=Anaeromicropila populeti TaxID=37658 RepID=A0A1I6KM82_9FIRM|nr:hypothetical protein [Anaeromicropila populeti]SFR92311.1 hypothetical protein SAMN05661086_02535 [Anaeromicropila populeti]
MNRTEMIKKTSRTIFGMFIVLIPCILFGCFSLFDKTLDIKLKIFCFCIVICMVIFFVYMKYPRYINDIIKGRTITIDGRLIKLDYLKDYHQKSKPENFDYYELYKSNNETITFSIEHSMYINEPKADKVRCVFLEKSHELLSIEVLSYADEKRG